MNLTKALLHLMDAVERIAHVCARTRQMVFAAIARLRMHLAIEQASA